MGRDKRSAQKKSGQKDSVDAKNGNLTPTKSSSKENAMADTSATTEHDDTMSEEGAISSTPTKKSGQKSTEFQHEPPAWFTEVSQKLFTNFDQVNHRLGAIEEKLNKFEKDLHEMNGSIEFASKQAKDAAANANQALKKSEELKIENEELKSSIQVLKTRLIQQESHSRRNNLLFINIAEKNEKETWADCENVVRAVLQNEMDIMSWEDIKFERVHRIGTKIAGRIRPIIAKFCYYKERELVWGCRKKLANKDTKLSEDYPPEILEERRTLYPILKAAKNSERIKAASMRYNKLYIDSKLYGVNDLNGLPTFLRPENFASKQGNGVYLFASSHAILSNLYSNVDFKIASSTYCSTEQYYQYKKATYFNDDQTAAKIMAERNPYKILQLGKTVKEYDESKWLPRAEQVLFTANIAKFMQNEHAREVLLSTGKDHIGEATHDPVFGIGTNIHDPQALNKTTWSGKNLFGQVLEKVRVTVQENMKKQKPPPPLSPRT